MVGNRTSDSGLISHWTVSSPARQPVTATGARGDVTMPVDGTPPTYDASERQ